MSTTNKTVTKILQSYIESTGKKKVFFVILFGVFLALF